MVPGTSPELKVSFECLLGTQRGTPALEGVLAMPSEAIDVPSSCPTCLLLPVAMC